MRGFFLATCASLAFWSSRALAYSLSQDAETASRVFALILLPCAVVAILTARNQGYLPTVGRDRK